MAAQERNAEDVTCLVLLEQIAAAADATRKLDPPEAATALRTLAGAYTLLVNPPLDWGHMAVDEASPHVAGSTP
ncbi:hypothetical protein ACF1B0_21705 [Streptomyces anandii]|uniref:hypothetical protein n=1 Tax=Streptomyces anandii TaxID=285454 RepID=UPI0036FB6583